MSDQFLGEIRIFGFNFAPYGWALCDGSLVNINQYSALYSLLGTTYGGNGTTNFGLPDFRGRAAMHWGSPPSLSSTVLGQAQGADSVTLSTPNLPAHVHALNGTNNAPAAQVSGTPSTTSMLTLSNPGAAYSATFTPAVAFSPKAIGIAGGSQPHSNAQPRAALLYCIALTGAFPLHG